MSLDEPRRTIPYIYQADLSDALPDFDYTLVAFSGEVPLLPHTAETRAAARAANPNLLAVPDERLTHFSAAVEVPFDAACRVHIAGTPSDRSRPSYVHLAAITVPPAERPAAAVVQTLDYLSTAKCFLFHHPDLLSEDCAIAAIIMEHMADPFTEHDIQGLADELRRQGPPRETEGGWARLVPFQDTEGETHFLQQPSARTVRAGRPAMALLEVSTKNDLRLENRKWTQEEGFSVITEPQPGELTPVGVIDGSAGEVTVKPDIAARLYGVKTFVTPPSTPGDGTVRAHLRMENYFLRFLGAYIQFLDIDGNPLSTPAWKPDHSSGAPIFVDQQDDLRWLGGLGSTDTIFGAPNPLLPGSIDVDITFPKDAVAARLYALGLGTGRIPYPVPNLYGAIRTALINLAIPALLLPAGVAITAYEPLRKIFESEAVGKITKAIGVSYAAYVGIGSAVDGKVNWSGLSTIGQTLFQKGLEEPAEYLGKLIAKSLLRRSIPFAGWIMAAIDVAIGIAQITQTIVAVATSPWAIINRLSTSIQSLVTVNPDPVRGTFPSAPPDVTRVLNVRLIYQSDHPTVSATLTVPSGSTERTLPVRLTNNLGGRVKFQCEFLVGSNVAATASTDWLPNNAGRTETVGLTLFQKRIELTRDSVYEHASLLTFQDGRRYVWMPTKAAPETTRANRSSSSKGNAISELTGISLSQRHHQLGYAWRAAGLGIANCAGGTVETQLFGLQSVSIPGLPVNGRFSGCGYSSLANIVYDSFPPRFKMKDGRHETDPEGRPVPDPESRDLGLYYIDPLASERPALEGGGYHLRRIPDTGTAPINTGGPPPPSYGRFPLRVDSLVIHPSGRVVALNHELSEIMVTTLESEGRGDSDLPFARRVAGPAIDYSPPGSSVSTLRRRPGLLANPIAVASTYDGTIMVLENIEQPPKVSRLQAFDGNGNPVKAFRDRSGAFSPFLELPVGRTYLSLALAGGNELTDIFILYYTGTGNSPDDYHLDIYQAGSKAPPQEGSLLVSTPRVSAAALAVDLFRTLYTLNWSMTTDGKGNLAGPRKDTPPPAGPAGRTVPSLSEWLPRGTR